MNKFNEKNVKIFNQNTKFLGKLKNVKPSVRIAIS